MSECDCPARDGACGYHMPSCAVYAAPSAFDVALTARVKSLRAAASLPQEAPAPCPHGEDCPDARKYGDVHPAPSAPDVMCPHDLSDQDVAWADGHCALCLRVALEREHARAEFAGKKFEEERRYSIAAEARAEQAERERDRSRALVRELCEEWNEVCDCAERGIEASWGHGEECKGTNLAAAKRALNAKVAALEVGLKDAADELACAATALHDVSPDNPIAAWHAAVAAEKRARGAQVYTVVQPSDASL